jgi:hypothetical protein
MSVLKTSSRSSRTKAQKHLADVDISKLVVWKTEGEMTLKASREWKEILEKIDVNDRNNHQGPLRR